MVLHVDVTTCMRFGAYVQRFYNNMHAEWFYNNMPSSQGPLTRRVWLGVEEGPASDTCSSTTSVLQFGGGCNRLVVVRD